MSRASGIGSIGRAVAAALLVLHGASSLAVAARPVAGRSARAAAMLDALRSSHHAAKAGPQLPYPYAAIVVDANSGAVMHADQADEPRRPASLTKVMTLYLLFEALEAGKMDLESEMVVSEHASDMEPTKLHLEPGDTLKVEDAILGLVTHSANDAAVVVAEALAGSEPAFAARMTLKARELGMNNTVYRNASGLPDDEQFTTARDQATLGCAIQKRFPECYAYFSTQSFSFRGKRLRNHNKLLGRVKGMDGIKTGYIRSSKFNLLASVRRDGRHIVAVVLGGPTKSKRDARMRSLIEQHIACATPRKAYATERAE